MSNITFCTDCIAHFWGGGGAKIAIQKLNNILSGKKWCNCMQLMYLFLHLFQILLMKQSLWQYMERKQNLEKGLKHWSTTWDKEDDREDIDEKVEIEDEMEEAPKLFDQTYWLIRCWNLPWGKLELMNQTKKVTGKTLKERMITKLRWKKSQHFLKRCTD